MEKKKRWRKLAYGPAAIFSAILVAILSLLGLIQFSTPSTNDSQSENREEEAAPQSAANALVTVDPNPTGSVAANLVETLSDPEPAQPMAVVDVLIDGDVFHVGVARQGDQIVREPRAISEVVRLASEISGDASGVRVRITRTFDATAQAEQSLLSALTEAGLSNDEIDFRRTLVESPDR